MGLMLTASAGDAAEGKELIDNVVITSHGDTPHGSLMGSVNDAVVGARELPAMAKALTETPRKSKSCKPIALVSGGQRPRSAVGPPGRRSLGLRTTRPPSARRCAGPGAPARAETTAPPWPG